ncbi:hypothetical protein ACFWP3_23490 [Streptomyces sp. NPDC058525]|uniref:hypothetical protein n=1 Tax=Streptomyces sp. NPDC058525 TaxID=3346538 RepID=UPI003658D6A9
MERHLLDEQFATADAAIWALAVEYLAGNCPDPGRKVSTQVRRAQAGNLGTTPTAITGVARLLSVHRRHALLAKCESKSQV